MKKFFTKLVNKLNPAQPDIVDDYGDLHQPSANLYNNQKAYKTVEVINRGVNLIVDSSADIKLDIGDMLDFFVSPSDPPMRIRKKKLEQLLNFRPNPFYNADVFKRVIFTDLLLEGDAYIYFDGSYLYNLPALNVDVIVDKKTYIKEYKYAERSFSPNEIIHIKENAGDSIFVGSSRLDSAKESVNVLMSMKSFQKTFFNNSAVPGLVLTTPNPLSQRVKDRLLHMWRAKYNPAKGGKSPMILDGDFKVEPMSKYNFKELDFVESIKTYEETILKALGIPPILLDTGNNANINPNLRMFYINTILPLTNKVIQGFEMYFGYDIKPITHEVLALRPELRDFSNYLTAITNAGIITRNEAREEIRKEPRDEDFADELVLPANIAGSAENPSIGGRPSGNEGNNDNDEE
jgi:HK97 family phage portal protein